MVGKGSGELSATERALVSALVRALVAEIQQEEPRPQTAA